MRPAQAVEPEATLGPPDTRGNPGLQGGVRGPGSRCGPVEAPSLCLRGLLCDVGDSKPPVDLITTRPLATLAGPSPATPGVMSGGRGAEAEPRRLSLSPLVPQAPPDHQPGGCVSAGGGLSTEPPGMCSSSPSHPLASALSPTSSGWRKAPAGLGQGRRGTHGTAGPAHRAGPWALGDPQEEGSGPSAGSDGDRKSVV